MIPYTYEEEVNMKEGTIKVTLRVPKWVADELARVAAGRNIPVATLAGEIVREHASEHLSLAKENQPAEGTPDGPAD